MSSPELFTKYVKPFDLVAMKEAASACPFNILHVCDYVAPYSGYEALLREITGFFKTGVAPVSEEETLEVYAFMEAADESKRKGGVSVSLAAVLEKARKDAMRLKL